MIGYDYCKIVYDKKHKYFYDLEGNPMHNMGNAGRYPTNANDIDIINEFDDDTQKYIEVWYIKITLETMA